MAKELLFDDSPDRTIWATPDEQGLTLRTRFKGTQDVLDENERIRNATPKGFGKGLMHHAARIPMEVWEQWVLEWRRIGGPGYPPEGFVKFKLGQLGRRNKLMTRDIRL
jgi:hypothetical protein